MGVSSRLSIYERGDCRDRDSDAANGIDGFGWVDFVEGTKTKAESEGVLSRTMTMK
jgi:hypothetical protein